jgi:hypothetical protein
MAALVAGGALGVLQEPELQGRAITVVDPLVVHMVAVVVGAQMQ